VAGIISQASCWPINVTWNRRKQLRLKKIWSKNQLMHIQKLLGAICVAGVVGAGSLKAQSSDSDIQAKAREALRQKMAEMNTDTSASAPAAAMPAPAPAAMPPAASPAPISNQGLSAEQEARVRAALEQATTTGSTIASPSSPAPVAPAPAPAVVPPPAEMAPAAASPMPSPTPMRHHGLSPEDQARVRAALEQATATGGNAQTGGTNSLNYQWYKGTVPPVSAPTGARSTILGETSTNAPMSPAPAAVTTDNSAQSKPATDREARMKLREEINAQHVAAEAAAAQQIQETKAARQAAEEKREAGVASSATQPVASVPPGYMPVPAPSTPPVIPTAGSKEQRLAELLRLYKSDQITPTEYHEQRAKIIAEP
jgi:hypothetical protein